MAPNLGPSVTYVGPPGSLLPLIPGSAHGPQIDRRMVTLHTPGGAHLINAFYLRPLYNVFRACKGKFWLFDLLT